MDEGSGEDWSDDDHSVHTSFSSLVSPPQMEDEALPSNNQSRPTQERRPVTDWSKVMDPFPPPPSHLMQLMQQEEQLDFESDSESSQDDQSQPDFDSSEEDMEIDDSAQIKWKDKIHENAIARFHKPLNLMRLVYERNQQDDQDSQSSQDDDGEFKLIPKSLKARDKIQNAVESSRFQLEQDDQDLDLEDSEVCRIQLLD